MTVDRSPDFIPSNRIAELREICEREIATARQIKDADLSTDDPKVHAWVNAHGDRMKVTHPVKILQLLDYWEDESPQKIALDIMQSESMMWLMVGSADWQESHIESIRQGWNAYLAAGGKSWGKA